jgi:hypothetical protein
VGVLYDYFRAVDVATAIAIVAKGGPASRGREHQGIDVVEAKGVDDAVILGKLIALARGAEWDLKTSDSALVWTEDEAEGPWLTALADSTRDTLGSIQDDQLDELAAGWSQIEEFTRFSPVSADELRPGVVDFVGLARRALDAGDHLYCWMCL